MKKKMTHVTRAELANAIRGRYRAAAGEKKRRIPDEFIATTGYHLAAKERNGAKVAKRYHPPQTPCERLLQAETISAAAKDKLREVAAGLDPLKLLEEMRAVQAYLAALADGEAPPPMISEPPNLAAFVASLSSAWHAG